MDWDWEFTVSIMPQLIDGVVITIQATFLGTVVAMVMGRAWAILRRATAPPIASAIRWFVEFIRGMPLLVQLYFLFYSLPHVCLLLSPLTAGVIGLGLHYSAYTAEVYRAGIDNVPKGQREAVKAVNLSPVQTWNHIVIPKAVPPMIPALANYFVAMFKETPLLSAITVLEPMNQARSATNFSYRYLEPMTMVGVFFLLVSIPAGIGLRYLERRYGARS